MKREKAPPRGWHYIAGGDYPPEGESVLVHVADMSVWVKNTIVGQSAPLGMYEQNARYEGKENGLDVWGGVPLNGMVTAWRAVPVTPDSDKVKQAIADFQNAAKDNANLIAALIATTYNYRPEKNMNLIKDLTKKFLKGVEKLGLGVITDHNTQPDSAQPVAYIDSAERVFTVETRYGHGVIVQFDKGSSRSRYAFDYTKWQRIYPDERGATVALMAEAVRQNWKRVG